MRIKTYAEAKAIKKRGFYRAGDTLYLRVGYNGSKSWIQRLTIDGERHDIGLGSFKLVTLAEARDIAFENRKGATIHKRDPLAEKRKAKIPIFREAAMQTYEALKPRWRSGKHTKNWLQIMEKYAIPVIGTVRIDKLGREDVLKIVAPLWTKRPETARQLRQKMRTTFKWAQANVATFNYRFFITIPLPAPSDITLESTHQDLLPLSEEVRRLVITAL